MNNKSIQEKISQLKHQLAINKNDIKDLEQLKIKNEESITRLTKEIKTLEASLISEDIANFQLGDVFDSKDWAESCVILSAGYGTAKYILGGLGGNLLNPFSNEALYRESMIDYLHKRKAKKIGKIVLQKD